MASVDKHLKNSNFLESLNTACQGIVFAFCHERNLRFHAVAMGLVFALAGRLSFSSLEWVILVLTVSQVIVAEMVNSALEYLTDLTVGNQWHPFAKRVKDVAAGAVLITALAAVLIGGLLFLPKLINLF